MPVCLPELGSKDRVGGGVCVGGGSRGLLVLLLLCLGCATTSAVYCEPGKYVTHGEGEVRAQAGAVSLSQQARSAPASAPVSTPVSAPG
jgi:hypothetical protein